MATKRTLNEVLKIVNSSTIKEKNYHMTNKNRTTLYTLGITISEMINIIENLNINDFHFGPEMHDNHKIDSEVWVFKTYKFGELLYIKLYLLDPPNEDVIVISAHIDNM